MPSKSAELKEHPVSAQRALIDKMLKQNIVVLLITIMGIQSALSAHGNRHPTGSEIRRLRQHSSRSIAGKHLKGVELKTSDHVVIGIPSASQVTPMITIAYRHRHSEAFPATRLLSLLYLSLSLGHHHPFLRRTGGPPSERAGESW